MNRLEGNGASRFVQLMKRYGKSDGISITVATVTKAPPALSIRIDGDTFDLSGDELVVAEHLMEHKRTVSVNGGAFNEHLFRSPLAVGDKVIVIIAHDGQLYYVMEKAV